MILSGLALTCRYSYPPNSLSLCGPSRQEDLCWYTQTQQTDQGTKEILQQFTTLYSYLCFIAGENNKKNPFDYNVVDAYWIGNSLLHTTRQFDFLHFMKDTFRANVTYGALPHHAFHVLNVYKRTGHLTLPHTIETMDACIVNWGKIIDIRKPFVIVQTKPLIMMREKICFGNSIFRTVKLQGEKDVILHDLSTGDWISYHWGYVCEKLTRKRLKNLQLYTHLALKFANT